MSETTDEWTITHSLVGFFSGLLGVPSSVWILTTIGWEVVEPHLVGTPLVETYNETPANSITDIIVGVIGNIIGNLLRDTTYD